MDYFRAKINHFVIEQPGAKKTTVRSFISRPTKILEKKSGRLFGLIEIENTDPKISELIDVITEELKTKYYSLPDENKEISESDLENNFEAVLQKINLTIASFLESKGITIDLERINIALGVIAQRQLIFSQVGKINIYLLQNLKKSEYRIIDILEATKTPIATPNPLKIFSQVIAGRVNPRDIVFISTPNVLDYFSLEKIKNVISGKPGIDGLMELKELLEKINSRQNFGVLISEVEKTATAVQPSQDGLKELNYRQAATEDSMKELIKTERETEKLLTPSFLPEAKKYAKAFGNAIQNYLGKVRDNRHRLTNRVASLPRLKIPAGLSQNFNWQKLQKLQSLTRPIQAKTKTTFEQIKKQPAWQKVSPFIKKIFGRALSRFNQLPRSSKKLLIVSILLGLLFILSVVWFQVKNSNERDLATFNQIVTEAESKKNESEASLIYRDENKARELLIAARESLNQLKPKNDDQKSQISLITQGIEDQLQKLRHLVSIDEPTQIINFQNLDSQAKIANLIISAKGTVYTQNTRNKTVYKANLTSRVISGIFSDNSNPGNFLAGTTISDSELLFLNDTKETFSFSPGNDSLKEIPIATAASAEITDLAFYNNRLFLLDKKNGQIYRYTKTNSGFGSSDNYLEDNQVDLKGSVSLTIDGSLYVLKNNGEIIKLQKGKKVDFALPTIDPALTAPTKIKTTEGSNYLYILEPANKRLVVINKDGRFVNQYVSPKFDDLKDFIAVESEKKIYILNGSAVYGIPAEHL